MSPRYSPLDEIGLFLLFESAAILGAANVKAPWALLSLLGLCVLCGFIRGFVRSFVGEISEYRERVFSSDGERLMKIWIRDGMSHAECPDCDWERDQGNGTTRDLIEEMIEHKRVEHTAT